MDSDGLVDRILPPRRAAIQAAASFVDQLTDESDSDLGGSPQQNRRGGTVKGLGHGKGRGVASVKPKKSLTRSLKASASEPVLHSSTSLPAPLTTNTRPHPRPIFNKSKQPPPPAVTHDIDSDLSPLSSPLSSPAWRPRSSEHPSQIPGSSRVRKRRSSPSESPLAPPLSTTPKEWEWDFNELGTYVWVLLDENARVLELENTRQLDEQFKERVWWPGKIIPRLTRVPLAVHLFGTAAHGVTKVEIRSPCRLNVLSLEDPLKTARFTSPTFVTVPLSGNQDLQGSPRKKQRRDRGDLEDRWRLAVAEMMQEKDDEEGSDAMPEVGTLGFSIFVNSVATTNKASLAKDTKSPGQGGRRREVDEMDDHWSPPPADDNLQIPGELVLARESQNKRHYWPAKILQYITPTNQAQEGKYVLEFLDGTILDIPRRLFYTTDEDEFGSCLLGEFQSTFKDVLNDDETEQAIETNSHQRSPSPIPCIPLPTPFDFTSLGIRQQFAYTKNILRAILNEEYNPAKRRHDLFISGGQGRKSVVDEAGLRGKMDPKQVGELEALVSEWCLRDGRRVKEGPEVVKSVDSVNEFQELEEQFFHFVDTPEYHSPSPSITEPASSFSSKDIPPSSSFGSEGSSHHSKSVTEDATSRKVYDQNRPMQTPPFDTPPRQRGCEAYEALTDLEKIDYCLNVLLPEAILQILLWRGGHRTSVDLLPKEEEEALHKKGDELLKERDWVYDVLRLRASKVRRLERTQSKASEGTNLFTSSGRPKRNVFVPKSYTE